MGEMTEAKRLRLGVAVAVLVLAVGVEKVAGAGWAVLVSVAAVLLVGAAVLLGNKLGARRANGE